MTRQILNKGSTHYVVKLMIYCVILVKRQSIVKLQLTKIIVLVFMVLFYGTWTILQLMLSVPRRERVYGGFRVFHIVHIAAYYLS